MWNKLKENPPKGGQEVLVRNGENGASFWARYIGGPKIDNQTANHGFVYKQGDHLDFKIAEWMELPG